MTKRLLCCLALVLACPVVALAQTPDPQPLTESDKREILVRLGELRVARQELDLQRQHIARDEAQDKREAELAAKEIKVAESQREVVARDRDLWKEKAEHYQMAYETVSNRGRGFGCAVKKVFTLGLGRCK